MPTFTTETYGHLTPNYLRSEVDRLSFGGPAEPFQPEVSQVLGTRAARPGAEGPLAASLLQASGGKGEGPETDGGISPRIPGPSIGEEYGT
jgi:integrase